MNKFKYEFKTITYKSLEELSEVLTAFSNNGWEYVETKESFHYKPLKHTKDEILFRREVK